MECPTCGSKLKEMTERHISSNKHQDALREQNINESEDPALELLKSEKDKIITSAKVKSIESKEIKEDIDDLGVPDIPDPPKRQEKLTLDINIEGEFEQPINDQVTKGVLVNCSRCGTIIQIPVPRTLVINNELPVVPISFIHFNPQLEDLHVLTVFIDHDFDVRRQRLSDVLFSEKFIDKVRELI
ncbi:MAG: hypothetical protein ACTSR8_21840 [Promethearchaeota archaeon]